MQARDQTRDEGRRDAVDAARMDHGEFGLVGNAQSDFHRETHKTHEKTEGTVAIPA
jgi:hypothetical protein